MMSFEKLSLLDASDILEFRNTDNLLLQNAIKYFYDKDPSEGLVSDLKIGFLKIKQLLSIARAIARKEKTNRC